MALEKAVIINLDTDEEFEVLFNPKEYIIEKRTPWKEHEINGLDSPAVEFTIGERKRLSMELYFDTSEEKSDVREFTGKIEELMLVNSDQHRPPLIMFSWGNRNSAASWKTWSSGLPCSLTTGPPCGPF